MADITDLNGATAYRVGTIREDGINFAKGGEVYVSVDIDGQPAAAPGGGGSGGTADTVKIDATQNTVKIAAGQSVGVTGNVAVTGPLTDTQLRATALPVSISSVVGGSLDVAITAPVDVVGPLTNTQATALERLRPATNRSGTITAANISQVLAAQNNNRQHLFVQNISDGDLWMSEYGPAEIGVPGSYRIAPGLAARILTNNAITIIGAEAGQGFTASEINI